LIIDCHGHYTNAPAALSEWRRQQLGVAHLRHERGSLVISDDEIRETLETAQLRLQRARGTDLTLFSPRASAMGHHLGDPMTSRFWAERCNELIHRVCELYPQNFVGVCQLPQSPGTPPDHCIAELRRCVEQFGFVGCNLNPDPSGGAFSEPPLTDRWWYPLYEVLCELDVPAMIHVSQACHPALHTTGSYYLNADTAAFMQLLLGDLFRDFPTLRLIIPHGGGAVPYHWGRFRGLAQDLKRPSLEELMGDNVFFDTCVYHQPGIELLFKVVPTENLLFGSEMVGAVRGIDPQTGRHFDDTRSYIEALSGLSALQRRMVFELNPRRVLPRLERRLGNTRDRGTE
jgi:4-oxalmesaconate hydratase